MSNVKKRRNLGKKRNIFKLDVIPLESEAEVKKEGLFESMKTGVKETQKNTVGRRRTAA